MQLIVSSIQKLLKQKLNIYSTTVNGNTDLKKDLNLVDWEFMYLLNAVEQTWHISIAENEANDIVSVKHLMETVKTKQGYPLH